METTIQHLEELAEKERCAGNRQKFLEIKKEIEIKEQEEVLSRHKRHLEEVTKEFKAGTYIPELRASVKEIKDGCGTKEGWVNIYLSSIERPFKYWELKKKIRKSQEEKEAREYFDKLKFNDKNKSLYIGRYFNTIELLIKVMALDLPTEEDMNEYNLDWTGQIFSEAKKQAIENGYTDEEAEEMALKAEGEEMDNIYKEYKSSILKTLNYLLNLHDIELEEKNEKYYLTSKSWKETANKVARTITGYGMFELNSGKELKEGLPCKTYCEAAIQHLHWLKYYPEIYGVTGYR